MALKITDRLDDGSMRNDKRQEALETIKTSKSVRVILISFKAGSTGQFGMLDVVAAQSHDCRLEPDVL